MFQGNCDDVESLRNALRIEAEKSAILKARQLMQIRIPAAARWIKIMGDRANTKSHLSEPVRPLA
jgi:hypothetical protein